MYANRTTATEMCANTLVRVHRFTHRKSYNSVDGEKKNLHLFYLVSISRRRARISLYVYTYPNDSNLIAASYVGKPVLSMILLISIRTMPLSLSTSNWTGESLRWLWWCRVHWHLLDGTCVLRIFNKQTNKRKLTERKTETEKESLFGWRILIVWMQNTIN